MRERPKHDLFCQCPKCVARALDIIGRMVAADAKPTTATAEMGLNDPNPLRRCSRCGMVNRGNHTCRAEGSAE